MHCDSEAPVLCQMTDKVVVSLVMKPTQGDSEKSDSHCNYTGKDQHGSRDKT